MCLLPTHPSTYTARRVCVCAYRARRAHVEKGKSHVQFCFFFISFFILFVFFRCEYFFELWREQKKITVSQRNQKWHAFSDTCAYFSSSLLFFFFVSFFYCISSVVVPLFVLNKWISFVYYCFSLDCVSCCRALEGKLLVFHAWRERQRERAGERLTNDLYLEECKYLQFTNELVYFMRCLETFSWM